MSEKEPDEPAVIPEDLPVIPREGSEPDQFPFPKETEFLC